MAKNLFDKTKSVPKGKPDKTIRVTIEDETFFDKVKELGKLNDILKSTKSDADDISDELRSLGKSEWVKLYEENGENPGSIILEQERSGDIGQFMLVPSDKYITITPKRADELREEYGEEIVNEEVTYTFDNAMIEKYGEVISRLINESDEIDEDDREKIIKQSTTISISKGTIDLLAEYGEVSEIMEAVKPVVSIKNIEIIKG